MRDLIDDPHPAYTATMMADLMTPGRPAKASGSPLDGDLSRSAVLTGSDPETGASGPPTQCHAGAGEGLRRSSETRPGSMRAGIRADVVMDAATFDALMLAAAAYAGAMFDAAARAADEAGMTFRSDEAWAEGDAEYRERLRPVSGPEVDRRAGESLDWIGRGVGLPRARLVPVEG